MSKLMNTVKRLLAATTLALGFTVFLLGCISAAAILAIVAAPFMALHQAVQFMEQTKGNV